MRKWFSKAKIKLLILGLVFIGVVSIAGNISLLVNKSAINANVSGIVKHDIAVGPVLYVFPDYLILNDVVISDSTLPEETSTLAFSKVGTRFSLWKFLFDGELQISEVIVYPSDISYYALSAFLENNIEEIIEFIRQSSAQNFKLRVKETLLDFDRQGTPDYVVTELVLAVKDDLIEAAGLMRTDQYDFSAPVNGKFTRTQKGWPLFYRIKGKISPSGFNIEHLIFKGNKIYTKLWGAIRDWSLQINGFSFMDSTADSSSQPNHSLKKFFKKYSTDNEIENVNVHVLDIDGRLKFAYPSIDIQKFYFTINNVPVTINGNFDFHQAPALTAKVLVRHPAPASGQDVFFDEALLHLTSRWENNVLESNGDMKLDFIEHGDISFSPETVEVTFNNLRVYLDRFRSMVMDLEQSDIAYWTDNSEHKISVHNLKAIGNTTLEGLKVIKLDGPFYNGELSGTMTYIPTQIPSKIMSRLMLSNVDTDALEEFLVTFAKFNGSLTSTIKYVNVPQMELIGDLTIHDGTMTDFEFFNWVADSFKLPALKSIEFKRANARFAMNKQYAKLFDINLRTDDVRIKGYFNVDNKNLVSSQLTISLSKKLLSDSSKFRPIIKIFDKDDELLDFEFQLSGNLNAMNFQWLPSDDKKKIQARIPDFIERSIEDNIDEMMEPGS